MQIILEHIGKKFGREWLFRKLNFTFETGKKYALTGYNGSGKTTLLKIIASATLANEGTVSYLQGSQKISEERIYKSIAWTGPYTGLPPEMTLAEIYTFYHQFKPIKFSLDEFAGRIQLEKARNKSIQNFSSGMKQKLQIALALFSESRLLLLDEPSANFDQQNTTWLKREIMQIESEKTVIMSSNQAVELSLCDDVVPIEQWKP